MSVWMRGVVPFGELAEAPFDETGPHARSSCRDEVPGWALKQVRGGAKGDLVVYPRPEGWRTNTQRNKTPSAVIAVGISEGHGLNSAWLNRISFQTLFHSIGSVVVLVDGCDAVSPFR